VQGFPDDFEFVVQQRKRWLQNDWQCCACAVGAGVGGADWAGVGVM
jgi:hypothetical protein